MPQLRIRTPFAVAFVGFSLLCAYLGFTAQDQVPIPEVYHSDKGLHFIAFFILTICFYWILDTTRRRLVHITLLVCTAGLSIGSEVIQGVLPENGRDFDPLDIMANVLGSTAALLLCSWYHKRMLERKRQNKHYDIVPGEELGDDPERDVELGEAVGAQEIGVIPAADAHAGAAVEDGQKKTVTEELDGWDENAEDWDDDADGNADPPEDLKKRAD